MTKFKGDNDPVDVCELGSRVAATGEVYPVKLLGALGMIDEGEMDWKYLALALDDPLASKIHDLESLEKHMPGRVAEIVHWFKVYKIPDGKPENKFAFNDKPLKIVSCLYIYRDYTHFTLSSTHTSLLPFSYIYVFIFLRRSQ